MAQIPPVKDIRVEAFPSDQQSWIGQLLTPLNLFMLLTSKALESGLTFRENFQGQEFLMDFTMQGVSDFPKTFRNNLSVKPVSVQTVSALEDFLPVIVNFSWQMTPDNQVQIADIVKLTGSGVTPLSTGKRYQIRFRTAP